MFDSSGYSGVIIWLSGSILFLAVLLVISRLSSTVAFIRSQRRLAKDKTLIHEYKAPAGLTPPELGYLLDRKFRDNELLALLVSMHQAHIITVKNEHGELLITNGSSKKQHQGLSLLEIEVISLLEKRSGKIMWKSFSKSVNAGNTYHAQFERLVHQEMETKGYFEKDALRSVASTMKRVQLIGGLSLSIAFVLFPLQQAFLYSESNLGPGFASVDKLTTGLMILGISMILWPVWYAYVWIISQIIYHGSGLPFGATPKLRSSWPHVHGHMVFLRVVERNRLNVDPNLNDAALPWAIAVGAAPKANKLR